ncbi:GCN5-related N-acetyltransferase [Candidatus Zixiibacteriota bacterium]|nr:GCN5-related N-acetyltransferase [candidate division Zixibacteria bacterium]
MTIIRRMRGREVNEFIRIAAEAYPGMKLFTAEERERARKRYLSRLEDRRISLWGAYRGTQMVGGMRYHDFNMNLFGKKILAGGVGMVAVDLRFKKERICKEMIQAYLEHYRDKNAPLAVLWPFRPDFYRKMGFGYGAKISQYRVKPEAIPKGQSKKHIRFFGKDDITALVDFYSRYCTTRNGMIEETRTGFRHIIEMSSNLWLAGYEKNGRISGFMNFGFAPAHEKSFVMNDIVVREMLYESREALSEMMTFLNSQSDQIAHVIINVVDDDFHNVFLDPRNGTNNMIPSVYHESNACGVGIMYRVLDTTGIWKVLEYHDFNGQSFRGKFNIIDTFLVENNKSLILEMDNGHAVLKKTGRCDFEVTIDISDFSSMLMGAIGFEKLWELGRAEISDNRYIAAVNKAFRCEKKPLCLAAF